MNIFDLISACAEAVADDVIKAQCESIGSLEDDGGKDE